VGFGAAGSSPEQMVRLHSQHNLGNNLELDAALYLNSRLSFQTTTGTVPIANTSRFDLRLGWRPSRQVEVNLIGRNLLEKRRAEYFADDVLASEVPRSLLLQMKWKY
jgi:iron complex outermembrane receptor protein